MLGVDKNIMKDISMNKYIQLAIFIIGLELLGALSGITTKDSVGEWYTTLNRSPLTPPGYIFGIVWSFLYATIAISGWLIWQKESPSSFQIKSLFIFQLILNLSWTPLFFYFHLTGLSFIWLIMIVAIVFYLIFKLVKINFFAGALLIPYLFWLLLACQLNHYIWTHN
jgi:benzodiazapine receptor